MTDIQIRCFLPRLQLFVSCNLATSVITESYLEEELHSQDAPKTFTA